MSAKGERRRHRGWLVVGILFALSVAVGILAYSRFITSDRRLRADLGRLAAEGRKLSVEGCVDATIRWSTRCAAMKSLCDATTPQMMARCLGARDRTEYCRSLGDAGRDTHFGFKECKARGVNRKTKKTCAIAYRAIRSHCDGVLASARKDNGR